jgi:hypothetical protein
MEDFLYGISAGYRHDFNELKDFNVARCSAGLCMKLFTTLVGNVFHESEKIYTHFTARSLRSMAAQSTPRDRLRSLRGTLAKITHLCPSHDRPRTTALID